MKAYSNDLRERAVKAREAGEAVKSIAQRLEVSDKWVYKITRQYRETGHYEVRKSPGRPCKLKNEELESLAAFVKQNPDATLRELKEKGELDISIASIARYLLRLRITFKKNSYAPLSKRKRKSKRPGRVG